MKNSYKKDFIYFTNLEDDPKSIDIARKKREKNEAENKLSNDQVFENKFWHFLVNIGFFNKINTDRECIISFNDIQKQIDIVAESNECRLFVECSIQKKVDAKITSTISKYKEYRPLLVKEINDWNKLNITHIFFTNAKLTEKNKSDLKNNHIKLITEDVIDYFIELSKSYKKLAYFQFLHYLFPVDLARKNDCQSGLNDKVIIQEVGSNDTKTLKLKEAQRFLIDGNWFIKEKNFYEVPALVGEDSLGSFYVFSIEPHKILPYCTVPHRKIESGDDTFSKSYQRLIDRKKIGGIQDYILDDGQFPTNLILNFNQSPKIVGKEKDIPKKEFVTLKLEPRYALLNVIDGQHRLFSYIDDYLGKIEKDLGIPKEIIKKERSEELAEKARKHKVTITAYDGIDTTKQIQIFVDVNEKQKPVSKNLLWDLYPEIYTKEHPDYFKVIISKFSKKINTKNESDALYHNIKYPSCPYGSKSKAKINLNNLCNTILTLNFIGDQHGEGYFHNTFKRKFDIKNNEVFLEKFYDCFSIFFNTSKEISKNWDNNFYGTDQYLASFLRIFNSILEHVINTSKELKKVDDLSENNLKKIFKKYLSPAQSFIDAMKSEEIKNFKKSNLGEGGPKGIWKVLILKINEVESSFEEEYVKNINTNEKFEQYFSKLKEGNEKDCLEAKETFFVDAVTFTKNREIKDIPDYTQKICRTIIAMANGIGGILLIGVGDPKTYHEWKEIGVRDTDLSRPSWKKKDKAVKYESYIKAINDHIEKNVDTQNQILNFIDASIIESNNKTFVLIQIEPISYERLVKKNMFFSQEKLYVRNGESTKPLARKSEDGHISDMKSILYDNKGEPKNTSYRHYLT